MSKLEAQTSEEGHQASSSLKQDVPSGRRGNISDMQCSPKQAKGLALGFVFQMIPC